jgi:hypothetical protein
MPFIKKRIVRKSFLMAFLMLAGACSLLDFRPDGTLIAKAYNNRLYLEDIQGLMPMGADPADSAAFVKRYVDNWISGQVFLYNALQSMAIEETGIEQRVKDYRNVLIIHSYESFLVSQEMDTIVTNAEMQNYYNSNTAYFTLRDHIVHASYVKMPLRSGENNQIRALYRSNDPESLSELEEICLQHAATYYINHNSWMLFSDILRDMPLRTDDMASFLRNNRFAEITDDYFRYFLYVHEYRLSGDISPLDFERENIRALVLNQRKKLFIEEKRQQFFNHAIETSRIESFL